jgi:hypothetical protein
LKKLVIFLLLSLSLNSLAAGPSCGEIFSPQKSFSTLDSFFNFIYKYKTPKVVKKFDQAEYDRFAQALNSETDIKPEKPEHFMALIDQESTFLIRKYSDLEPLSKKKLIKAVSAYYSSRKKSEKQVREIAEVLIKGSLPTPVSLASLVKMKSPEYMKRQILEEHIEYFLLLETLNEILKPTPSNGRWAQLKAAYREKSEYILTALNFGFQFTFSTLFTPTMPFMPDLKVKDIPDFQRRVEQSLKDGSSDKQLSLYVRSDFEYRLAQTIINASFWAWMIIEIYN